LDHDRVHPAAGSDEAVEAVMTQWTAAISDGKQALLLAQSRRDVEVLNARAREHLVHRGVVHGPVLLDNDTQWRAGDVLRATRNNRRLSLGDTFVRNGDRFTVLAAARDGLLVEHTNSARTTLPAAYVREHATYGWASTIDSAQGATVDVGILLARPGIDREHLYVGLTRGRDANHIHLAPAEIGEDHHLRQPEPTDSLEVAVRALVDALARSGRQTAAHTRLTEPNLHKRRLQPVDLQLTRQQRPLERDAFENHLRRYTDHDHGLDHDFGR
jgi:hypothetical protein